MDDDWKENRRNKPQQKLYKPGSGPLRRSSHGLDSKMNSYDVTNGPRSGSQSHYGSKNSIYEEELTSNIREHGGTRHKKPEQQLYVPRTTDGKLEDERHPNPSMRCDNANQSNHSYNRRNSNTKNDKHAFNNSGFPRGPHPRRDRSFVDSHSKNATHNDVNYNRSFRQVSEPRSMSPTQHVPEVNATDRNRDTRSMETSAGRHNSGSGGKPPSGRRNSAGYPSDSPRPKYTLNLDNLPPRLRKKFLEQSGHSFEHHDHTNKDKYSNQMPLHNYNPGGYNNQTTTWSQTLPSRGRGRLRDNEGFDRDKFINSYLKTHETQSSQRSTPSSSYMNLYESNSMENKQIDQTQDTYHNDHQKEHYEVSKNDISNPTYNNKDDDHSKNESDSEPVSCSSNLMDMTNLDWNEEVEKNMKFDDVCDSTASSPSRHLQSSSISQNIKSLEAKPEPRESKRSGRSKRRDKRSYSRGQKGDKRNERIRRDSGQQDIVPATSNLKQRDRERRDSHRSNHSSNIGNSRDDLDRWRSLRSFSREQSTEGRLVSQCNSRDTSANRALSPRDRDGFRIPSAAAKNSNWTSANQKKNGGGGGGNWGAGRNPSAERGRQSPAPSAAAEGGGGGRRSRRRSGRGRGRNAEATATPAPHPAGATPASVGVNWRDEILESKKHSVPDRLDRHQEVNRNRLNSTQSEKSESSTTHPGLLILPQSTAAHLNKDRGHEGSADTQKMLYDHHNPSKPIMVQTNSSKADTRLDRAAAEPRTRPAFGGGGGGGGEVSEAGEAQRAARHRPLLHEVDRADAVLQAHTLRGPVALAAHWNDVTETRKFLQGALQKLLMSDLKYCQADNVEHHFWKILYYNLIEVLRKHLVQASPEDKPQIVKLINTIIEEGNVYFENLVQMLEKTYKFSTGDYINDNHSLPPKGLGYVGLALISVQKLYVFLGDLARYKEQVNETNNYAKSKYFYTKAQQINPKNGRPYNQLAILAIYARRKFDAVFYYMRSLMSSNPFHSARESLISLFDENRKKYETAERKRRAMSEATKPEETGTRGPRGPGVRREVWVRPSGRRTTTLRQEAPDDALAAMTSVELNKNFITSYLHVHGKLVTKIGMETCRESAALMLRQFRALLHRQPLPTPAARLLQLTALNMFAVESTLPAKDVNASERSAWLECAVSVSLLMFGALLERCCALLPEPHHSQQHADALLLLPAVKVWSDWMLCHSGVWNPPPSFDSFDIGSDINPWDWLAKLMNILETLDDKSIVFESEMKEGYEAVRLPEDGVLAGFTPLMYMEPAAAFVRGPAPAPHLAEHALRTRKLLFFGTEYLVGVDPPALRLEYPAGAPPRYVSAVQRGPPAILPLQDLSEDSEESAGEPEPKEASAGGMNWAADTLDGADGAGEAGEAGEATRRLLRRKGQLESRRADMERRRQRMQELLRGGWVSVEVEVRPRWLVPDTNCFIDHLPLLRRVLAAPAQPYLLAVPIVVVSELEGLRRCARVGASASAALAWLGAGAAGAGAGGAAPPGVRFATSRGSLLASRVFTAEREVARATNDDRVLSTALNLHATIANEPDVGASEAGGEGACVRRVREVVLLTDDRNLRVKALAAELPARDLPSFVEWTALPDQSAQATEAGHSIKSEISH